MKFSKQQRHEIYVDAKKRYVESVRTNHNSGLCWELQDAVFNLFGEHLTYKELIDALQEFREFLPEEMPDFWWRINDTESRFNALNVMIEKTKQ